MIPTIIAKRQRYRHHLYALKRLSQQPKAKAYGFVILSFITSSFFALTAIKPTIKTIASLKKEIDDKQTVSELMQNKINSLATAQTIYSQIQDQLYLVDQALPQKSEFTTIVKYIENLAAYTNTRLVSLTYKNVHLIQNSQKPTALTSWDQIGMPPQKIDLDFSLEGDYFSLKSFADSLEKSRRIITISSAQYKINEGSSSTLNLVCQASIHHMAIKPIYFPSNKEANTNHE